jgi:hypothetical protein
MSFPFIFSFATFSSVIVLFLYIGLIYLKNGALTQKDAKAFVNLVYRLACFLDLSFLIFFLFVRHIHREFSRFGFDVDRPVDDLLRDTPLEDSFPREEVSAILQDLGCSLTSLSLFDSLNLNIWLLLLCLFLIFLYFSISEGVSRVECIKNSALKEDEKIEKR